MTRTDNRPSAPGAQGWFDDNPVARMREIVFRCDGDNEEVAGKPCGRNLHCPLCQQLKDKLKLDIFTHGLKVDLGELPTRWSSFASAATTKGRCAGP